MGTSTEYIVFDTITTGYFVPLFISILSVAWLIGIATKAMKSKDLT